MKNVYISFCLLLTLYTSVSANQSSPYTHTNGDSIIHSKWMGFDRIDFKVAGRNCLIVMPDHAANGKPWIWRMEFFGHEPQGDSVLLTKGFHVVYMDMQNMYGAPVAMELMDKFYRYLAKKKKLGRKTVLEGFSRGGLFAFNWAANHPKRVSCIYVDAPVCDFKSWPAAKGKSKGYFLEDWQRLMKVYGFKNEEEALQYSKNPVDNLQPLAAAGIPILSVCGMDDTVVPMAENTTIVEQRYKQLGGEITVIAKPNNDHHPHSLKDPTPIVDFILKARSRR
ncbi:MAG: alpha/beta fold hydrolase [Chitinophagaceae bacterium]